MPFRVLVSYCGSAGVWALHEVPAHSGTQVLSGAETGMSYKGGTRKEHSHRGQAEISKQAVLL